MGRSFQRRAITAPEFKGNCGNYVDVTITTAQILALNATPQTIVGAPGANKAIIPMGVVLYLPFNSVAYSGIASGEDFSFKYTNASGAEVLQVETTGFLDASASAVRFAQPNATLLTPVANAAIVLHLLSGEVAAGNSPLKIRFYYRTVPTVL